MSPQPPDFNRLFAEGSQHDFGHWRAGCVVTVRIEKGAQLRLPTGRLVACEPWTYFPDGAEQSAFVEHVEPGAYPVELVIAKFADPGNPQGNTSYDQVAGARLVVLDEPVTAWRLALLDGQDEAHLAGDESYGYPVDGGTGAFGSPEVFDSIGDNLDDVGDFAYTMVSNGRKVDEYVDGRSGNNLVIFVSGDGDGYYATWVGFTATGQVACFVTDFLTLTAEDEEYDESEEYGEEADRDVPNTAPSERVATIHDESGLVTVGVFRQRSNVSRDVHTGLAAHVREDMVVVGGGGTSWSPDDPQTPNGALLTASCPDPDLSAWLVSTKDHQFRERHQPVAYAVGLAVTGLSRDELRAAIHVSTAEAYGQHLVATSRLPEGYVLIGGGAIVEWRPGQGNLLTASFPSDHRSWTAEAKDHHYPSPARLRVFALGLREVLPVGRVAVSIGRQTSEITNHPSATAAVEDGYALIGGGARANWRGAGSLLWTLVPLPSTGRYAAGAKDHGYPAPCDLSAYAVGIRIVPWD